MVFFISAASALGEAGRELDTRCGATATLDVTGIVPFGALMLRQKFNLRPSRFASPLIMAVCHNSAPPPRTDPHASIHCRPNARRTAAPR